MGGDQSRRTPFYEEGPPRSASRHRTGAGHYSKREPAASRSRRRGSQWWNCFGSEDSADERTVLIGPSRRNYTLSHKESTTVPSDSPATSQPSEQLRKKSHQKHDSVIEVIRDINSEEKYCIEQEEWSLGGRLQKYWCVGSGQGIEGRVLLTVAPLSKRCTLSMQKKGLLILNTLVAKLGKHPLLQPIHEIRCYGNNVVIIQPMVEKGSLRDYLHKLDTPLQDWTLKYGEKGKGKMKGEDITLCARSILEAVLFLYSLGFPPVGHIQTGNIFKTPEGYKLGGYENTLLGYKSRYHHLCMEYGNAVDLITLGHVIYEMASQGRELTSIIPEDDSSDYQYVTDREVGRVLKSIFSRVSDASGEYQAVMEGLLHDSFFTVPEGSIAIGYDCDLKGKEKKLLKAVTEGKGKQQKQVENQQSGKQKSYDAMDYYVSKRSYYYLTQTQREYYRLFPQNLKSIGTRPGKYWGKAQKEGTMVQLLSAAKVSEECPIFLTPACVATIKKFFETNCKHPNLFPPDDLKFYSGQVLLVQEFKEQGSLRDIIYQTEPWSTWSEKSKENSHGIALKKNEIQLYSQQILMACEFLYQMGFPQLGQIQSGNLFVVGGDLRLGGFENTLLGYNAVGSDKFQRYSGEHLDRIMFGHVVFEMGAGTTVETPIPSDSDYSKISDRTVRKLVKDVFADLHGSSVSSADTSGASPSTGVGVGWTKLLSHDFFKGTEGAPLDLEEHAVVSAKMRDILKSVRKGTAKKQRGFAQASATLKKVILQ